MLRSRLVCSVSIPDSPASRGANAASTKWTRAGTPPRTSHLQAIQRTRWGSGRCHRSRRRTPSARPTAVGVLRAKLVEGEQADERLQRGHALLRVGGEETWNGGQEPGSEERQGQAGQWAGPLPEPGRCRPPAHVAGRVDLGGSGRVRRVWTRWIAPVVVLALLGLGHVPAAPGGERQLGGLAEDRLTLVVSLSPGWAQPGLSSRTELGMAPTVWERPGLNAGLDAPDPTRRPGVFYRAASFASSPASALATRTGGRSPPADAAR